MSKKAGNFPRDCYNLQRYRDSLISAVSSEDDSGTNGSSSSATDSNDEGRQVKPGPNDIKKQQQETLEKNKRIARDLVKKASTETGLLSMWAFYNNTKEADGRILVKNEEDRDMYYMFIDTCVVNMISKATWKSYHNCTNLSKYITVSDEAFAMLILENIAATLMESEGVNSGEGVIGIPAVMKGRKRTTRYTKGGRNEEGQMRGWRNTGVKRFNELCENVIVRRGIKPVTEQLELDLKKRYQRKKREEEEAEDNLELQHQETTIDKKKRTYVQGYDMSMRKMPKLEQSDFNVPEEYKDFKFDITCEVAL